jgi:hypothetical protein
MLGTISLLTLLTLGYLQLTPWIIAPFALANSFIGLHFPAWKAERLRERGQYWQTLLGTVPLQAVLAAIVYGAGFGISKIVETML